jgi:hypothetical protein
LGGPDFGALAETTFEENTVTAIITEAKNKFRMAVSPAD